ncbi:MAG: YIP1 family protein [Theionarchaea archaeon]|nr:YIP1 family protein [Theionarchaea archaeon]
MLAILIPWRAGKEFRRLKAEKKWLVALVIVFTAGLLTLVGNNLIQKKTQVLANQYIDEMGVLTEQQRDAVEDFQSIAVMVGVVIGIGLIPFFWVAKSAVFHVLARILKGEETDLSSAMHVIGYTYLPLIFQGLIDLYKGLTYKIPSYEEYVREIETSDALLNFVREHNIFFIWSLILMVIAVRELYSMSNKKAALVVVLPYVVAWLLLFAFQSVSRQLIGGM